MAVRLMASVAPKALNSVLAVACFSGAAISPKPTIAAILGLFGLGLFVWPSAPVTPSKNRVLMLGAGAATVSVVALSRFETVGPLPRAVFESRSIWTGLVLVAALGLSLSAMSEAFRWMALISAALAVIVVTLGITFGEWEAVRGFDAYRSHQAVGVALLAGENPYGNAIETPNGSPFAPEGAVIVGYSYPPVVAGAYGVTSILGDPRVVSAATWFLVLAWFGWSAVSRGGHRDVALSLFVVLATAPVWSVVLFAGWTEPLSLALLLGALLLWKPRPVASAILLGLALASKQFFVFLAPILLVQEVDRKWTRALVSLGTAFLTLVPALAIDAGAYYTANIGNLADIGFRPDTQSLPGLLNEAGFDFFIPLPLWVGVGLALGLVLGRFCRDESDFIKASVLVLSFVFLTGSAFPNYWFLVMGMAGIAILLRGDERIEPPKTSRSDRADRLGSHASAP
jgi:hypothetical protein